MSVIPVVVTSIIIAVVLLTRIVFTIWVLSQSDSQQFLCIHKPEGCGKSGHIGFYWSIIIDLVCSIAFMFTPIFLLYTKADNMMTISDFVWMLSSNCILYWLFLIPTIGCVIHDMVVFSNDIPRLLLVACIWQIVHLTVCIIFSLACHYKKKCSLL